MSEEICRYETMRQVLEALEKSLAGKRVFRYLEDTQVREKSAEQFFGDIKNTAQGIRTLQAAGGHIGIMGRNRYEWMVCLCAVLWTGSVAVLLDRELSPEELARLARKADVSAVFCDSEAEKTVALAQDHWGIPQVQSWSMSGNFGEQSRPWAEAGETDGQDLRKEPQDLACIFFTSGTTGESKAVMMSEHGLAAGVCHRINDRSFQSLLAVLPFHHLAGFSAVLNAFYLGAEVCVAEDVKYFYRYLEQLQPDYVPLVPSMLRMLARKLENKGPNGRDLGWNLRMISCGGAAFCPEFLQTFLEHEILVVQGYGASEAGAIGFLWEMTLERPDTIGKPPQGLEVKIQDKELYLRSESVMMGYYKDARGTAQVLRDGWYATGDLCRRDEEGYLYLTGRKKDLIILANGENISPEAVEAQLYRCGDISEVLVGDADGLLAAAVYPRYPQDCTEGKRETIKENIRSAIGFYNQSVPLYRQIQKIRFLDQPIRKTAGGKLLRRSVFGGR